MIFIKQNMSFFKQSGCDTLAVGRQGDELWWRVHQQLASNPNHHPAEIQTTAAAPKKGAKWAIAELRTKVRKNSCQNQNVKFLYFSDAFEMEIKPNQNPTI